MSLWFAGANDAHAPRDFQRGCAPTGKLHTGAKGQSHLDTATLEPTPNPHPHGKRRAEPGETWAEGGQVAKLLFSTSASSSSLNQQKVASTGTTTTPRHARLQAYASHLCPDLQPQEAPRAQGVKVFKTPPRTAASSITPTPRPSADQSVDNIFLLSTTPSHARDRGHATAAPFASDLNNDPANPYIGMRRKITEPRGDNAHDGDAFVLKRSRTPPAGANHKETTSEGFGVLLASSLKSRANPQMVPSAHYGKMATQRAEQAILEKRQAQEAMVQEAVRIKSMRAYEEEKLRVTQHRQEPERQTGRGRCSTPPPTVGVPFALNYPVPRDLVGKRLSAVHSPRRWVR
jgi:hypothetical protein